MEFSVDPSMRYYEMGSQGLSFHSLAYTSAVILVHKLIPYRLLCLRTVSVLSTVVSLMLLYRLARQLFCRQVGIIFLFLLITSPNYLKFFSTLSLIPLSNMVAIALVYAVMSSLTRPDSNFRVFSVALLGYLTLGLYIVTRLILVLPVLMYAAYFRANWKKLILYVGFFIFIMVILDFIFQDGHFRIGQSSVHSPELLKIEDDVFLPRMLERLEHNLRVGLHYLGLQNRGFYSDQIDDWRIPRPLIFSVFLPFFWIGLLLCLFRRRRVHVLILFWFSLLFLGPFVADDISLRRICFSLNPILLLTALGLWLAFRVVSAAFAAPRVRRLIAGCGLLLLLVTGGCGLGEYVCTSRPRFDFNRHQLRRLAQVVSEKGRAPRSFRYNRPSEELIWGNPYFDRTCVDLDVVDKMELDRWAFSPRRHRRPVDIPEQVVLARGEGGNIIYMYTFPPAAPGKPLAASWGSARELGEMEKKWGDAVELSQVPGIDEVYFLMVKPTE